MARNGKVGDGHRNGAVRGRTQTFNPKTGNWLNEIPKQENLWMLNQMVLLLKE